MGVRRGAEAGRRDVGADLHDSIIDAVREASGVEQAGAGRAVQGDLAGDQEGRGHHDQHGVDIGEAAGGGAFVGDAVLGADDGDFVPGGGFEIVQRAGGVLALHGQQHDIVVGEGDVVGMAGGLDGDAVDAVGLTD